MITDCYKDQVKATFATPHIIVNPLTKSHQSLDQIQSRAAAVQLDSSTCSALFSSAHAKQKRQVGASNDSLLTSSSWEPAHRKTSDSCDSLTWDSAGQVKVRGVNSLFGPQHIRIERTQTLSFLLICVQKYINKRKIFYHSPNYINSMR